MKKLLISNSLKIFSTLLLLNGFDCLLASDKSQNENVEQFIKVSHINSKVILVTFGYDAVTAINTEKGIIVIDAGISNKLTEIFRKKIEKEFNTKRFAYLINTHSHSDHTGGNQVFQDAVIIGQANCINEMKDRQKNIEETKSNLLKIIKEYEAELKKLKRNTAGWNDNFTQMIRYKYAYEDLLSGRKVTYPKKTFTDTLKISVDDITLNIIWFGKAHSASDIIIHIPELKLLFTGDLFFPGGRPSLNDYGKKDVQKWQIAKEWIQNRLQKIETVIGGHGQLMKQKDIVSFNKFIDPKWMELKDK